MTRFSKILFLGLAGSSLLLSGCNKRGEFSPVDMWNRSRIKPLEPNGFFADGSSSQAVPPGTVYRGQTERDKLFPPSENGQTVREMQDQGILPETPTTTGNMGPTGDYRLRGGGATMTKFPFKPDKKVLLRGKQRYEIYCSPCHGRTGAGDGMIVRRGFSQPPTYHQDRLRKAPVGHFFDVITNGYGAMYPYADKVSPEDRWAIAAYIRALQLSQNARKEDVPAGVKVGERQPIESNVYEGDHGGEGHGGAAHE